jgi:hypothetical protein
MEQVTASVGKCDIEIAQGSDDTINIFYKPGGAIANLDGYTGRMQIRKSYTSSVLLELSTARSTITCSDGASSTPNIVISFKSNETSPLTTYTDMIYDLEIVSPTNLVTKIIQGKFSMIREITR